MESLNTDNTGVVYTDKAQCRDCYRCVRACPVKAIRMENSQAAVAAELCISCGTCVKECPQTAKKYRHDLALARSMVAGGAGGAGVAGVAGEAGDAGGGLVAVSIAPSFAGRFEPWQQKRMASVLRALGFSRVAETAVGAWHVAAQTADYVKENPGRPHIATACPAVVAYVEKYRPQCSAYLTPIASPMITHARLLKQKMGLGSKVVFIGPCIAKKTEADRDEYAGLVDCVLTFEELDEWMRLEDIDIHNFEESDFDEKPVGPARNFPLPGGAILTAGISADMLSDEIISVSGFDEIEQMLDDLPNVDRTLLIEPLMCRQGCINGPAMGCDANLFSRRTAALAYAADNPGESRTPATVSDADASNAVFHADVAGTANNAQTKQYTEEEIQEVLAQTGKTDQLNQLNCGACGYDTCREKAIAVLRGLAESEMCIPYMRRLAEQRTDRIIETSPNGIVILDQRLQILSMNPAFREMFRCGDAVCGRPISYLIDPVPFEQAVRNNHNGDSGVIEGMVRHDAYSLVCHQVVYALADEGQYVGIFVNITRLRDNQRQLDALRRQTLTHARQLHEQQVDMARQIAEFLGQSTARGERLLEDLMAMSRSEENAG